jgi:hypothetical protein
LQCLAVNNQHYDFIESDPFIQLLKETGEEGHMDICFECKVVQTGRSRHCYQCLECIDVWDHHCPWINNCVGKSNYLLFCVFLVLMDTYAGLMVYLHGFLIALMFSGPPPI